MDGDAADLYLFGTQVSTLGAWHIRATPGALTFTAIGHIPAYWLSAGATTARVRCVARESDRRPFTPAQPYTFWIEGVIAEMDGGRIVITNVRKEDGNVS